MKTSSRSLSVSTVVKKIRNATLDLAPEYQRGKVWSKQRQALLIDSVLKGYDLPKFYVRQTSQEPETFEVVDGLQRLTSFVAFVDGDFSLPKESEFAGKKYAQLPEVIQDKFDDYQLLFSTLEQFSDEDVRDMFLRLQNGVRLSAAEELNAISGEMHDFVEGLTDTDFFTNRVSFGKSRGSTRHVAAQCTLLAVQGAIDVRKSNLIDFYKSNASKNISNKAAQLKTVINWLSKVFEEADPILRSRGQVLSIIYLANELWSKNVLTGKEKEFRKALMQFDKNVLSNDKEFKDYSVAISHSSDQWKSIEIRNEFLYAGLSTFIAKLESKDSKRGFNMPERVLAWYEAGGKCEIAGCGTKLSFQDFHADHKKAWSKGGSSSKSNLQVLCAKHNLSKGAK
jgi:hypothetical protein